MCQGFTIFWGAVLLIRVVVTVLVAITAVLAPCAAHTIATTMEGATSTITLRAVGLICPIPTVLPMIAPLVHGYTTTIPTTELALSTGSRGVGGCRLGALGLGAGRTVLFVRPVAAVVRAVALLLDLDAAAVAAGERVGLALFRLALRLVVSVPAVILPVTLPVFPDALAVATVEGTETALRRLAVLLVSSVAAVVDAFAAVDQLPHALAVPTAEGAGFAVFRFAVHFILLVLAVSPKVALLLHGDASSVAAIEGPSRARCNPSCTCGASRLSSCATLAGLLGQLHGGEHHQGDAQGGPGGAHHRVLLDVCVIVDPQRCVAVRSGGPNSTAEIGARV